MKRSKYKRFYVREAGDQFYFEVNALDAHEAAIAYGYERDRTKWPTTIDGCIVRVEVNQIDTGDISLIDLSAETVVKYKCKDVK